uniref:Argonaute linker 1 domain-containing protein n=1 Tax=Physcomitrium patens TaxID=3218 RepID=A0A7I4EIL6_PHYPA|nr:protein argonaute 4A-like [Physcomitrium patens]|eukprot:XP_024384187.1 protein argonaute 4A-like [Physcomitrella patens]
MALVALVDMPIFPKASRPEFERNGRPTQLSGIHLNAKLMKWDDVYDYYVSIKLPVTNKKLCRDIVKKLCDTYEEAECGGNQGVYDGDKSLFTSGSLNFKSKEFRVFLDDGRDPLLRPGDRDGRPDDYQSSHFPSPGSPRNEVVKRRKIISRERVFIVRIEFAAKSRMKAIEEMINGAMGKCNHDQEVQALDTLPVLNIVLRESDSKRQMGHLLVRDNFFHPDLGPVCDLGEGIEDWRGYHSSVRPTGLGMTLNLDITMTTMLKPVLVEMFLLKCGVRDLQHLRGRDWHKAKSYLEGVRIESAHQPLPRPRKISGFTRRVKKIARAATKRSRFQWKHTTLRFTRLSSVTQSSSAGRR